ncbi:DNA polymerase beta superfamily protein [Streptomyces sp. NPDC092296]|uniref:nucleotidyltransferase domain-containing protein n=1 Tax=Streptomyces sp. NPDC092296 TaxID=3366012 RepID=UPI00380A67AE
MARRPWPAAPKSAGADRARHATMARMQRWEQLVTDHTVLSVVVGSHAFGLATEASDTDRRGVYVTPASWLWRLEKPPPHMAGPQDEQFSWEVERFCGLALTANPNVLEVLHSPLVERTTPLGAELRELAPAFLSRRAHQTHVRYADAQFARADARRARGEQPRGKHLLHLLRLLTGCAHLLETGTMRLDVGADRERLLAVGRGEVGWDEVCAWRDRLVRRVDSALPTSPLPAEPDAGRVEEWLVSVRRRTLDGERVSA